MKRRDFSALLATTPLAGAAGSVLAQGGPVEGRQYIALPQPLPTAPGRIEVVEFFWYGCPHCFAFEPLVEAWSKQLSADIAFRKVHVAFRANVKIHQRMFYALESMGKEVQTRQAIFNAMHLQGQALDDVKSQAQFLAKLDFGSNKTSAPTDARQAVPKRHDEVVTGIDPAKYIDAYNSFGVQTKALQAEKLSEAYRIDGVPSLGIGGRFLTSPALAGTGQRMAESESGQRALQVTEFLIQRTRAKA
jgi:thiol:disulfide interchange protein DsbA